MTIETCIGLVDAMEPNGYSEEVKRRILEELEGRVRVELHGCASAEPDGKLTVPYPYDQIYRFYLLAMIFHMEGDRDRYESAAALFNAAYLNYGKWLKRRGE
jgi:hypothetical protein